MTANHDTAPAAGGELFAHLTDLLPVMRQVNDAAEKIALALADAHALQRATPALRDALMQADAAVRAYCEVSVAHSGLLPP